jgi:SET domain-containing protein
MHVSALDTGSVVRFVNHGDTDQANVDIWPVLVDGAWHLCAVTVAPVNPGEQLLLNYGNSYWRSRAHRIPLASQSLS